ncbi:hypothetical protein GCM10023100_55330 [Actinocorallia cavernae]|uniref:Uncharacterized protein n=3 Tax=Actinomycetes TaxID=1760 RepID=A0ABP8SZL7_9ACTN
MISRLSQILAGYPAMRAQGEGDFDEESDSASTLVGFLCRAEHDHDAVTAARDDISTGYLQKFPICSDVLRGEIGVASDAALTRALERLELTLFAGMGEWTRCGLG